jgi:tetratricopeptide (TPR) repeat protein
MSNANKFYLEAEASAATELARARFQLAGERVRLHFLSKVSDADLRQARENMALHAGTPIGYEAVKNVAAMLEARGLRNDAVTTLEQALRLMPPQERTWRDELNIMLGLIGDRSRNGPGRKALVQLLENGHIPWRQRQALELLYEAAVTESDRRLFRGELDRFIASRPVHPILESLLYYRAQLALAESDFVRAEDDAMALSKQFPLSPLRVHALIILTQSAWEQGRHRVAAENARKARAEIAGIGGPAGGASKAPLTAAFSPRVRANLGVLEAEASLRAGDFREAADAYAAVLRERAEFGAKQIGQFMVQRVLAEIRSGSGAAGKVIDELEADPAFDLESRWQAEWSLARALRVQGDEGLKEAYARVTRLLNDTSTKAATLGPEFRARMAWLQAQLSFDTDQPVETIRLVTEQLKTPPDIEPRRRKEIASILMLLKARAEFAVEREPAALETMGQLRVDYPTTEAAISSYIIEAQYYAMQDKIDEARNQLVKLTNSTEPEYKNSPYRAYAFYQLATLSERLGRKENLVEANERIEDLVETPTAKTDQTLYFAARMRQGDILRKLNQFPQAQQAYEDLVNRFPKRPDVVLAQLALADCHSVQFSNTQNTADDRMHADRARLLYEQLRDRVDAPPDVQVEAGYKLGLLLVRRGQAEEAAKVWLIYVVKPFLEDDKRTPEPHAKRPYWLSRTLSAIGELEEKRGNFEDAKRAYLKVLEWRLPYPESARIRLQQLGVPTGKVGQ